MTALAGMAMAAACSWAQTPVLHYGFPDSWNGTGTSVVDLSGAGHNGNVKATLALSSSVPGWATPGAQSINTSGGSILTADTLLLNNASIAAAGGFRFDTSFLWDGTDSASWGHVQKILDYAGTESLQLVTRAGEADLNVRFNDNVDVFSVTIQPNTWYQVSMLFETGGSAIDVDGNLAGTASLTINGGAPLLAPAFKSNFGDSLNRGIGVGQLALSSHLVFFNGLIYDAQVTLVPEPTSLALVGIGGLVLLIRRKQA
ncbi:MAG TPA: PEP-CTERM sorting domain-containing protein [Verrucomicrobiota bacterium]|nr:PEP-CTERM sorting domain-containing protein [Verrucomicrobiota bacterium]HNT16136.1 PEP-CTERM sorting domain-containing protein [Verrucomicrobiota bacterium]